MSGLSEISIAALSVFLFILAALIVHFWVVRNKRRSNHVTMDVNVQDTHYDADKFGTFHEPISKTSPIQQYRQELARTHS